MNARQVCLLGTFTTPASTKFEHQLCHSNTALENTPRLVSQYPRAGSALSKTRNKKATIVPIKIIEITLLPLWSPPLIAAIKLKTKYKTIRNPLKLINQNGNKSNSNPCPERSLMVPSHIDKKNIHPAGGAGSNPTFTLSK